MSAPAAAAPAPRKAITTPAIDAICIGGLSLVIVLWMLVARVRFTQELWASFWVLQVLINFPHFAASYRLLYQSKAMILRYKRASIYIPLALLAYVGFAFVHATLRGKDLNMTWYWIMDYLGSMYLAVHYTGQSWGMTASFAYLGGIQLTKTERHLLRSVFYVFMVWHIATYHHNVPLYQLFVPWIQRWVPTTYHVISACAHAAMLMGAVTFYLIYRRTKRLPPLRMLLPMPALWLGYCLYTRGHAALFVLQLSHALQYLIFPMRVELNRYTARSGGPQGRTIHLLLYGAGIVAVGWIAFMGSTKIPGISAAYTSLVLVGAINIHHYFIDGCVWKISTPEVRKDLFRHLQPAAAPAAVAQRRR